MNRIVLASGNKGKLREFRQMFATLPYDIVPQSEFAVGDVAETGLTFIENAIIKARHACSVTGMPAIADDSGIEVDALQGAPGIYSARFAGEGATDKENLSKLIAETKHLSKDQRACRFQCALVLMRHKADPSPLIVQTSWEGELLSQAVGDKGFGYDPVFWLAEHQCTSAQLAPDVKDQLSHRGQALRKLVHLIESTPNLHL